MPTKTPKKTVNYRRCETKYVGKGDAPESCDLQSQLRAVKERDQKPWRRPVGMPGVEDQFLTQLVVKHGCLCGVLVKSAKRLVTLVDAQKDGSTFEESIHPRDKDGIERPVEEQALFFAVRENHVAVIQSKELSIADLEGFLVWLIQSKESLAPDWELPLVNLPAKSAREKLKDANIKSIKIGRNLFHKERTEKAAKKGAKRKSYTTTLKSDPMLFGLLKQLLPGNAVLGQLEKSHDPGSLFVDVQISYRSKDEHDAKKVLNELAATFGGHEELNPRITLSGGKQAIKGDELTIKDSVEVQHPDNTISKDDAMNATAKWLVAAIKDGKVL